MYNTTNGLGQRVVGASITTSGYADLGAKIPTRNVYSATERAQTLNSRIVSLIEQVTKAADSLIGSQPECETNSYPVAPQPDGQVFALHAVLDEQERLLVALESKVSRLHSI